MLNFSGARVLLLLCLLPSLVLCSHAHEGRPRRHRHHEKRFFEGYHGHRRGRNHHGYHHGRTHGLVAENHVFDNSVLGNKVTEDPKKPGQAGHGSQWALTYQGIQPESITINNTISNVTAQLGGTAFLPCRVGHLGDRQISWIRKRDWHVLTSADVSYTNDQRFSVLHSPGSQDWTLHIKYVSVKDNGTYECQVSTGTGIISIFVNLSVVIPEAHIPGHGQYHVNHGSPITLTCYIKQSPTPPRYVSWYHNGNLLNYLRDRPDVTISTEERTHGPASSISRLEVARASDKHSGNYTCLAPNTRPASTMVFVTEGDKTAAVQRIDSGCRAGVKADHTGVMVLMGAAALWYVVAVR